MAKFIWHARKLLTATEGYLEKAQIESSTTNAVASPVDLNQTWLEEMKKGYKILLDKISPFIDKE